MSERKRSFPDSQNEGSETGNPEGVTATETKEETEQEQKREQKRGDIQRSLERQQRYNAFLTGVLKEALDKLEDLKKRLDGLEAETDAYGKQLEKVRASVKKDPCDVLDEYDRKNGWTDVETRIQELELEVRAESLSRFDRLSKMSTRQLNQDEEVSPREMWAILLLRNFDGWSNERMVGDLWFVSDGMKKMFHKHLQLDAKEPSEISTKKVHRGCDKAMELTDGEVLWVKLEGGRALVRPKDEKRRKSLEEKVKRTN